MVGTSGIDLARCDVVMANDLGGPHAARELVKMGVDRVFDPSKVVVVADHLMPAKDIRAAELLKSLKDWCNRQGVAYYDQGRGGIEHTVLVEEGWVVPGAMIVGADSHSCTYGALGAFGTGLGATDIAGAMALGSYWQIVPGTIVVEYAGRKPRFVTGKDLILALIAEIGVAGIVAAKPVRPSLETMRAWLAELEKCLVRGERESIYRVLHEAVPDFRSAAE